MVIKVTYSKQFEKDFGKIKDKSFKKKITKQIEKIIYKPEKIIYKPEIGKPMRYGRVVSREVYVSHFRLSYAYNKNNDEMVLLSIYHKDKQWNILIFYNLCNTVK